MPVRPEDSARDSNVAAEAKSSAGSHSPLHEEFFRSLAYTAVQQPYDGVSQAINYFGGNVAKRTFVEAPVAAEVGSSQWMAQQAGAGVAKVTEILLLHRGLRFAGGALGANTASSLALTESAVTGRVTAGSLATAGALYEGLVTKSGDNFFGDRMSNAAVAGTSMYLMGRSQLGLQNLGAVKSLAAHMPEGISGTLGRQMLNGATGFLSGGVGGAFAAEAGSLYKNGKFASASELSEKTFSSAIMGGAFGLVTRPVLENVSSSQRTGALPSTHVEALPLRSGQPSKVELGPDVSQLVPRSSVLPDMTSLVAGLKAQRGEVAPHVAPRPVALEPVPSIKINKTVQDAPVKFTDQHTPGS